MNTNADRPLNIGIACYPTFGGSGVVASEIGKALADWGHSVHFISYDVPKRLQGMMDKVYFHQVVVRDYPLFNYPPYSVAMASKMVDTALHEQLDILHVHYAVPHAASAFLACQVLESHAPKVVTTLHGTDITLVGRDPSYLPITRFSIIKSDAVTVPSQYLKQATYKSLDIPLSMPIEVINNFVDTERFMPGRCPKADAQLKHLFPDICSEKIVIHISNFRPAKRVLDVIKIFAAACNAAPCRLVLVGDGPERSNAESLARQLGIDSRVCFLGNQTQFINLLRASAVFLFPSELESFGLAALEAMACGVPVIASRTGGIPEVVLDGDTGFLCEIGDITAMAEALKVLLTNDSEQQRMSRAARGRAISCFAETVKVKEYERLFYHLLNT